MSRTAVILLLNLFLCSIYVLPQLKNDHGVWYPQGYHTHNSEEEKASVTHFKNIDLTAFPKIQEDFVINQGCSEYGSTQMYVNIAKDDDGNYLCVWVDERTGEREIYCQLYNVNDQKIGGLVRVSERFNMWNSAPNIAYNYVSGEYLITWAESGYDIQCQRISKSGNKTGTAIIVNQDYFTNTNDPSTAVDRNGNFIITWSSDQGYFGPSGAYYRIFDSNGQPISDQINLLSDTDIISISSSGDNTRIASDSSGNFITVWSSYFQGGSEIFLRQLKDGLPGETIKVSDGADSLNYFPAVASTPDGNFLVVWLGVNNIYGRIYHPEKGFITSQFKINEEESSWFTFSVSAGVSGNFYVAWTGNKVDGRIISKGGDFPGSIKEINIETPLSYWHYPKLTCFNNNSFYAAYYGYKKNDLEVMIQKFDSEFNPVGQSFEPLDDDCSSPQKNPVVKFNQFGQSIVVWEDGRNGSNDLYTQVLDKNNNPVNENFILNDSLNSPWVTFPEITSDSKGDFILSFSAGGYSNTNLYVQKVSPGGNKIGEAQKITNEYYSDLKSFSQTNHQDDYLLVWYNNNSNYGRIFTQKFNSDMIPYYAPKLLFNNESLLSKRICGISINKNFDILVTWLDYDQQLNEEGKALKAIILNGDGKELSDTIILNTLIENEYYLINYTDCNLDDERNIICGGTVINNYSYKVNFWRFYNDSLYMDTFPVDDYKTDIQIINFKNNKALVSWNSYNSINGVFFDDYFHTYEHFKLHEFSPFFDGWGESNNSYSADLYDNKISLGYESIKNYGRGYDIYLTTLKADNLNFTRPGEDNENIISVYPNPVNGMVTMKYEVSYPANVIISIFNLLGEKVAVVEEGNKSPGIHYATFDTNSLASGVYIFNYSGNKMHSRKFIILK